MLGRFLELALVTDDPAGGWTTLQRLGFADAASGDVWTHPYGVAACHGLAIGLHARGDEMVSLVFVRNDVAALERELEARFIDVESTRLGSDVFNELGLREPGGMLLRVVEARTFSPPPEPPARTAFGSFLAISLPCADLGEAQGFWERLGIDVVAAEDPWDSIRMHEVPLAYHDSADCREPALLFDATHAWDDAALRAAGMTSARALPALRSHPHRVLRSLDGCAVILLGQPAAGG
jgi:hypothetical protein